MSSDKDVSGFANPETRDRRVELLCKRQHGMSGIGRYASALSAELPDAHIAHPHTPTVLRPLAVIGRKINLDLDTFLQTHPLAANFAERETIKHLTSQEMGTWLLFNRHAKSVVTVHDILPFTLKGDFAELHHPLQRLFYRLAVRGLRFATHLIADSDYTKQEIVRALGITVQRITVIPLGVDHTTFKPLSTPPPPNLPRNYLLYVGSDAPRKNLPRLLEAFAQLAAQHPDLWLLKVGAFTSEERAQAFTQQVERLGLQQRIKSLVNVSAEKLVTLYNHARVFVFPSLYEGFGLPPLEAMACGAPVVCANATALPEVVGDAAVLVDGRDSAEIAAAIHQILTDNTLAATLRERGLARAQQFTWRETARQTQNVYQLVNS